MTVVNFNENQNVVLPLQEACVEALMDKYSKGAEKQMSPDDAIHAIRSRVATCAASNEKEPEAWVPRFLWAQENGFIAAGRINSAAGTEIQATLVNCFVQPIADAIRGIINGRPGIYPALEQAAETMRRGGGEGYNFSHIRPCEAKVKSTQSSASGPVSYMRVFNTSCTTVESAGARRGAQMGVLNISHPNIVQFIQAKRTGDLDQFNISVGVSDEFMEAMFKGERWELFHEAEPSDELINAGAYQREDGMWVYEVVDPVSIWELIMENTYRQADPGVLFLGRINLFNNLWYCETIEATNPCGEQPLPDYGCCLLGSINWSKFVLAPFSGFNPVENIDWKKLEEVTRISVRLMDNIIDVTGWPLQQQQLEAANKRRIGLGITGVGSMLIQLGLKYSSQAGRDFADSMMAFMTKHAYLASIELAKEKGSFPLYIAEKYLDGNFIKSLPLEVINGIAENGIRNSHLISIAPTGTISLAFGNNISSGCEPVFSQYVSRKYRLPEGGFKQWEMFDYSWGLYREMGGEVSNLPDYFETANQLTPEEHLAMVGVLSKHVDAAISKTINCPVDIAYDEFKQIYLKAYRMGLKGITTFRPNDITGSILSDGSETKSAIADLDMSSADRKVKLEAIPVPVLKSLKWPKRPECPEGNPSMTYMVKHPENPFSVVIGHWENGKSHPFEAWVNGEEQPRALGALAKTLSMDMRSEDRGFLKEKLNSLSKTGGEPFVAKLPGDDAEMMQRSDVAAFAKIVSHRCEQLGAFENIDSTPVLNSMFARKEPKSGTNGTLSWTVDVYNPATGDDFCMIVKELELPDGTHRPYSVWLSGEFPENLNGLCKSLSLDMRVLDTNWIAKKLRGLVDFPEHKGDFLAKIPGSEKMESTPSTTAYIARLIRHRYKMLNIFDDEGTPLVEMGMFQDEEMFVEPSGISYTPGKKCEKCGVNAVIKYDGCDRCTNCGNLGSCG